jgi:hypothetical protein
MNPPSQEWLTNEKPMVENVSMSGLLCDFMVPLNPVLQVTIGQVECGLHSKLIL